MAFNFGEEPLKHKLPQGYVALKSAPSENVVVNGNSSDSGGDNSVKIINNAPQAIIIEVIFLKKCLVLYATPCL